MAPVMSKLKKKNLQRLIQKRQQLENVITQTSNVTVVLNNSTVAEKLPTKDEPVQAMETPNYHSKEIRHTLISLVAIIVLLALSLYLNHRTTYFAAFGNWLYTVLRLKG